MGNPWLSSVFASGGSKTSSVTFPTESPLPVCVVAAGGGAPRLAIHPPVSRALFVGLLHEREGEDAELAIGRHCSKSKTVLP